MRYLSIFTLILLLAISCQNSESGKAENKEAETTEVEATANFVLYEVSIEGMTCTGCEQTIEAGVTKVDGVGSIKASHIDGNAQLKFLEGKVDTASVKQAIEAAGYKVLAFTEVKDITE